MTRLKGQLRRVPSPTIVGMIVLMVAIFLVQDLADTSWPVEYGTTPIDVTTAWHQLRQGDLDNASASALGTVFSAVFIHGSAGHVGSNMLFLWVFGSLLATHLGKWRVILLFLFTGACGNVMQVILEPGLGIPVIGASGGVTGLEGLYFGLAFLWHLRWPDVWPLAHPIPPSQLALFAGVGAAYDMYGVVERGCGIAYGAHVGGFFAGLVLAGLITQIYPTESDYHQPGTRSNG
mgnify:CR=1 FL=1